MITRTDTQLCIAAELGVPAVFDACQEIRRRVEFLAGKLLEADAHALVLGISGGVDSAVAGAMCQRAVQQARDGGHQARFVAMRLPCGVQADESDAQEVLAAIVPDLVVTVDIKPATDAMLAQLVDPTIAGSLAPAAFDYVGGNIKARQRMIAQYAVAGAHGGLVVGTDHAAEAVTGFYTKYGDGGADLVPLAGLTKRRVRALGQLLGIPSRVVDKTPTADLLDGTPQRADEDELGLTYHDIDDFLEARPVGADVHDRIVARYAATAHKRSMPAGPASTA